MVLCVTDLIVTTITKQIRQIDIVWYHDNSSMVMTFVSNKISVSYQASYMSRPYIQMKWLYPVKLPYNHPYLQNKSGAKVTFQNGCYFQGGVMAIKLNCDCHFGLVTIVFFQNRNNSAVKKHNFTFS